MQKFSYPISLAGIFGGLMLPGDILSIVSTVAENWPIMKALLPWVGTMMAVGFGTWLVMCLLIDVPRFVRRKVREKRDYWSGVMTRVADDIDAAIIDHVIPGSGKRAGAFRMDVDELQEKKLWPRLPRIVNGKTRPNVDFASQILYRMIPVVVKHGIRDAQRRIEKINRGWKTNPDTEALGLTNRRAD